MQDVRSFSLERVRAEIAWIARQRLPGMWIADANFGILPRDVEIARMIADAKRDTGFPKRLTVQYAKNTQRHLLEIIEIFIAAGLVSTGTLSVQTRDPRTLEIVRRRNIPIEEHDRLKNEFRKRGLPLATQLMIALPGATLTSFENDLRTTFDEPLETQIFPTVLLVNSPMAEPAYVREHRIRTDELGLVISTAAMSERDVETAKSIARVFNAVHVYGMLRYVLCFLRWDHGIDPIDVMHALATEPALAREYPLLHRLLDVDASHAVDLVHTHETMRERMRSEGAWRGQADELCHFVQKRWPVPESSALAVARTVAAAVMPVAGRTFPERLALEHDFVRYYRERRAGGRRRLDEYLPGELAVDDPLELSNRVFTIRRATRLQWELASALAAARVGPMQSSVLTLPWPLVTTDPAAC